MDRTEDTHADKRARRDSPRPYYADPTANTAITMAAKDEKEREKEQEKELKNLLIQDIKAVLQRAGRMNCDTVNFYHVPRKNLELVLAALRNYRG